MCKKVVVVVYLTTNLRHVGYLSSVVQKKMCKKRPTCSDFRMTPGYILALPPCRILQNVIPTQKCVLCRGYTYINKSIQATRGRTFNQPAKHSNIYYWDLLYRVPGPKMRRSHTIQYIFWPFHFFDSPCIYLKAQTAPHQLRATYVCTVWVAIETEVCGGQFR